MKDQALSVSCYFITPHGEVSQRCQRLGNMLKAAEPEVAAELDVNLGVWAPEQLPGPSLSGDTDMFSYLFR